MDEFALSPPEPVVAVPVERAAGLIPLDDTVRETAARRAEEFTGALTLLDPRSPDFHDRVDALLAVGEADMRAAAHTAHGLLDRSLDADPGVAASLAALRRTVVSLEPAEVPQAPRKLLRVFTGSGNARKMLDRYRAAERPITFLVRELRSRQDQLRRDNAAVKGERTRLWDAMRKLTESATLARAVDEAVERQAGVLDLADPAMATALRSDVLHPVRQRHQDILTQLAVSAQGYLALDLVRRTNDELIRGIERAVGTTVSALRIALTVSAALAGQKAITAELTGLQGTTEALLRGNSALLAAQTHELAEAGAGPAVGVDAIRSAFDAIFQTIDTIDSFRASATRSMADTVSALSDELRRAHHRVQRSADALGDA
ncbi:toxic anion resistance protein [Actinokineospora sp. 24-640]